MLTIIVRSNGQVRILRVGITTTVTMKGRTAIMIIVLIILTIQ